MKESKLLKESKIILNNEILDTIDRIVQDEGEGIKSAKIQKIKSRVFKCKTLDELENLAKEFYETLEKYEITRNPSRRRRRLHQYSGPGRMIRLSYPEEINISEDRIIQMAKDYMDSHPGEYDYENVTLEEAISLLENAGEIEVDKSRFTSKHQKPRPQTRFEEECYGYPEYDEEEEFSPEYRSTPLEDYEWSGKKWHKNPPSNLYDEREKEMAEWFRSRGVKPPEDDDESVSERYYSNPGSGTVSIWFKKGRFSMSEAEEWLRNKGYTTAYGYETEGFYAFPQMSEANESKYTGKIRSKYIANGSILIKFVPAQYL